MKLAPGDGPAIVPELENLASEHGYTKIFAKIQADALPEFITENYEVEAFIPDFYKNTSDCLLVSKFIDINRKKLPVEELKVFSGLLNVNKKTGSRYNGSDKFDIEQLNENNAGEITKVFEEVFETYPFPVHDPTYIVKTMREEGTRYFGVRDKGELIGLSTAEIDFENRNAEMTDFAVLPAYRGRKLAYRLLMYMEVEMKVENIKTVYTIARLKEAGMNKTFLNAGYKYSGTLVNNTNISGSIESMNVLYKHI